MWVDLIKTIYTADITLLFHLAAKGKPVECLECKGIKKLKLRSPYGEIPLVGCRKQGYWPAPIHSQIRRVVLIKKVV